MFKSDAFIYFSYVCKLLTGQNIMTTRIENIKNLISGGQGKSIKANINKQSNQKKITLKFVNALSNSHIKRLDVRNGLLIECSMVTSLW